MLYPTADLDPETPGREEEDRLHHRLLRRRRPTAGNRRLLPRTVGMINTAGTHLLLHRTAERGLLTEAMIHTGTSLLRPPTVRKNCRDTAESLRTKRGTPRPRQHTITKMDPSGYRSRARGNGGVGDKRGPRSLPRRPTIPETRTSMKNLRRCLHLRPPTPLMTVTVRRTPTMTRRKTHMTIMSRTMRRKKMRKRRSGKIRIFKSAF